MTKIIVSSSVDQVPTASKIQVDLDGEVMGQSEDLDADDKQGSFFHWIKAVSWDSKDGSSELTIKVLAADGTTAASHVFDYASILQKKIEAVPLENDAILAVQIQEQPDELPAGTKLKLHLSARDLENTERGLGLIRKSDPFYEIALKDGTILYKSETVSNNLNPNWDLTHISNLEGLSMSEEIKVSVFDEDSGGKREDMGEVTVTLQELLLSPRLALYKNQKYCGKLLLRQSNMVGADAASKDDDAGPLMWATQAARSRTAIILAESVLAKAQKESETLQVSVDEAETKLTKAEAALVQWKHRAVTADKHTEKCTGRLTLELGAKDLPNLDSGFSLRKNASDPVLDVYSASGEAVYESEVVEDNLSPVWKSFKIDLMKLCEGKLDSGLRFSISDMDKGGKKSYMGEVHASVNDLIAACKEGKQIPLQKGGETAKGSIAVKKAELVDFINWEEERELCKKEQSAAQVLVDSAHKYVESTKNEVLAAQKAMQSAEGTLSSARKAEMEAEGALESLMNGLSL